MNPFNRPLINMVDYPTIKFSSFSHICKFYCLWFPNETTPANLSTWRKKHDKKKKNVTKCFL